LVRAGSQLQVWRFGEGVAPAVGHRLEYDPLRSYRISPAGDWVVSEGQHEAGLIAVSPHHKSVALPSISGVGNYLGMQFVSMPDLDGKLADLMVTVTWNANQQVQMTGEYRNDTPHAEGQVWFLTGEERDGRRPPSPAAAPLIRRHSFKLVSSRDGSVFAVLEKDNPLQVMEPVSQASFTLGATAGPARAGMFSPDAQLDTSCGRGLRCWLAAVHEDGTARVWDIESRKELLRIASDQPIRDVAILQLPGEHDGTLGIVTRDASGRLQAWAAEPTRKTVADVVAR
jgi:WD40 repeat protein